MRNVENVETIPPSAQPRQHRRLMGIAALACIALQLAGTLPRAAIALAVWLTLLAVDDPATLRRLWRPRFWAFTIALALASGLLLGPHRSASGNTQLFSLIGLRAGLLMVLRGAFIFALASWATRAVSQDGIQRLATRVGLPGLGLAIATGLSLLPDLTRELQHTLGASKAPKVDSATSWFCRTGFGRVWRGAVWLVLHTSRLADAAADRGEPPSTPPANHERPVEGQRARPLLTAVIGARGAGKTTLVTALSDRLRQRGLHVGGIIQPAEIREGRTLSYAVQDLSSGETRPLAQRRHMEAKGFSFDPEGWSWAQRRIQRACDKDHVDVLVVDELGHLEAAGEGHLPAIRLALTTTPAPALILAVREDGEEAIQRHLGIFHLTITPDADAGAQEAFVDRLCHGIAAQTEDIL
ncbi:MAG: DUF2478 domain-containing protein, partial [Deltaproteobacteria bacterium]|nr:DUF2478 domain-containing protein [Deltaproteobacteria bacterium]